MSFRCSSDKI